jgi:hypothetical protein
MGTPATPKARKRAPRAIRRQSTASPEPGTPMLLNTPNPPMTNQPITNPPITDKPSKSKLKCQWDEDDNAKMIEVLTAERKPANAAIGPENATTAHGWKPATWKLVVEALAGSEEKQVGETGLIQLSAPKTIKACKAHMNVVSVSYSFLFFSSSSLFRILILIFFTFAVNSSLQQL